MPGGHGQFGVWRGNGRARLVLDHLPLTGFSLAGNGASEARRRLVEPGPAEIEMALRRAKLPRGENNDDTRDETQHDVEALLEPVAKVLVLHLCRKLCRSLS